MANSIFATVDPGDFGRMIEVERYQTRSDRFDRLIAGTHLHFWDPADSAYIDFEVPFDMKTQAILPSSMVPELHSAVADRLPEPQRIQFANDSALWWLSSILHGEQAAFLLSVSLCQMLDNPGTSEYAANQAREEARHVRAFSRYIVARWAEPVSASPSFAALLEEMVSAREVYKKLVGMQLLVEGLAMGIFSALHKRSNDPLLRRLTQLVMVDEAFHHRVGKIWSENALPDMPIDLRDAVEDWALRCFQVLLSNLMHPYEKGALYAKYDLDVNWVLGAMREAYGNKARRADFMEVNKIFHPMVKALLHAGVITKRTRHHYAVWANLKELAAQSEEVTIGAGVSDGLDFLKQINLARQRTFENRL